MKTQTHYSLPVPHQLIATVRLKHSKQKLHIALAGTLIALVMVMIGSSPALAENNEKDIWATLTDGNHFAIMRHAIAPGTGDPDNFAIRDCATQRNLSERGRQQAETIGKRFRDNGIARARVYSSQWCRCLETAELLDLDTVQEEPLLNSFFQAFEKRDAQTEGLRNWLAGQDLSTPLVLVTHQVNITALTGVYPSSGELVIVQRKPDNSLSVTGRIETE